MNEHDLDKDDADILAMAEELRALVGNLRRRLREEAHPGDFTSSQLSVLSRLHREGPATLTELARSEGMRPQSMSAIVSALEAAGFVGGTPHPTDGRQTILSLTATARETIAADRAAKDDWLFRVIRSKLSPDEQVALARGVALLGRLIEP